MTDINTYLLNLSEKLVLSTPDREKIDSSFDFLKQKIWSVFQNKLLDVIVFGSYDRGTVLPDSADKKSDVDVMIIFKENEFEPQTYLKQLRSFSEKTYPRSEVFPEHPTVVVELYHVRFELVPAYYETGFLGGKTLKIPASPSADVKWIETDPFGFKTKLDVKNNEKDGKTITIIKIFKYWNALNKYPFYSFTLEKVAVNENVSGNNLKECFYDFINELSDYEMSASSQKSFDSLKESVRKLKALEKENIPEFIEASMAALLPMP